MLATCLGPRRTGRSLQRPKWPSAVASPTPRRGALRSVMAALRWADVELADRGDSHRHRPLLEDEPGRQAARRPALGRRLRGCRPPPQAATAPEPRDPVVGLGVDQVNRRSEAACAATGLEGRKTSRGGGVELTARGVAPERQCRLVPGLSRIAADGYVRGAADAEGDGQTRPKRRHLSRDSTAIEAREKPAAKDKTPVPPKRKRGRPRKGEERPKVRKRLDRQADTPSGSRDR